MDLYQLFSSAHLPLVTRNAEITGITSNSLAVKPGYLFAAIKGVKTDGHYFIPQAIASGATAILAEEGTKLPDSTAAVLITVPNPAKALAKLAIAFYGHLIPSVIVGITGTNGKTSTASFLQQLWALEKKKSASLGTLGISGLSDTPDFGAILTTPDPITLAKILAYLGELSITHLAMEASSHGLLQHRLDGIAFQSAGFTNLTRDHMDYHSTLEEYCKAKLLILERLAPGCPLVINTDMAEDIIERIQHETRCLSIPLHTIGRKGNLIKLLSVTPLPHGQEISVQVAGLTHHLMIPLVGYFQVENMMMAAALSYTSTTGTTLSLSLLPSLRGVKGRMELAATLPNQAAVYVDYAHTPDALMRVLQALRPHTSGKLIVVFGAGGDRDSGKRPLMGQIASSLADTVIVTDDNPRSENPALIRQQILAAVSGGMEIGDRKTAIETGLSLAGPGDILVIAGKGHEEGQIIAGHTYPFNDVKIIKTLTGHP